MYLNLNIKEWHALQALLERFADNAHEDDVNHLDQVRRRMRSMVGDALKDIDKSLNFERWVHNESQKLRELRDEQASLDADKNVVVTVGRRDETEQPPQSERVYPREPAMPRPGRKGSRR